MTKVVRSTTGLPSTAVAMAMDGLRGLAGELVAGSPGTGSVRWSSLSLLSAALRRWLRRFLRDRLGRRSGRTAASDRRPGGAAGCCAAGALGQFGHAAAERVADRRRSVQADRPRRFVAGREADGHRAGTAGVGHRRPASRRARAPTRSSARCRRPAGSMAPRARSAPPPEPGCLLGMFQLGFFAWKITLLPPTEHVVEKLRLSTGLVLPTPHTGLPSVPGR